MSVIPHFNRKYKMDEMCFDIWTDDAAYWAGFLTADGHICGSEWKIVLCLGSSEKDHAEKFRKFLNRDCPVKCYETFPGYKAWGVIFNSRHVAERLLSIGLRRRNKTVICPELAMNPHYWRGVIDGDGSISFKVNTDPSKGAAFKIYPNIRLYGGILLLNQFLQFAKSIAPWICCSVLRHKSIFVVVIGHEAAAEVLKVIYSKGCTALERKRQKAIGLIHAVEQWQVNRPRKRRESSPQEKNRWSGRSARCHQTTGNG